MRTTPLAPPPAAIRDDFVVRSELTLLHSAAPRVLVVLVAHDGVEWLPRALDALARQTYADLTVQAIDNASTDGSREVLLERLGHERVLIADRDLGFGGAVSMALDAHGGDADMVWLLHDDMEPDPDALAHLVEALRDDPRLAIVGPKLRHLDDPDRLQSVGWTIDLTGRADSGVDAGELDQGQRDAERRALYVSTAGMLVRREIFEHLGRFDQRYHLFRDDLDLCWRAWLAGHEVEVVPDAVAGHLNAASEYVRLGQTRFIGPRYFAERNTLATLLKNYSAARLPLVITLYVLVGIAKVIGFLLTRRVSDAWQTVRAWVWNVVHLRETWRLRGRTQQLRRRSDRELRDLFGRVGPRIRAYVEAIADWIAGGDHAVAPAEQLRTEADGGDAPEPGLRRVVRRVRQRPILVASVILLAIVAAGAWPLLVPGELRGGNLAPWPESAGAFLGDYVSGWHEAGAFGTSLDPSPAQALLGLLQALLGGSSYLASRVLLLGSFVAAWILALRAAQIYSRRRVPRVIAATAYVLSPPALAALATGEVGALVVLAALPGIVAAGLSLARRSTPAARAWRSVSAVTLLGAIAGAFEPLILVALLVVGTVAVLVSLVRGPTTAWQRTLAIRVVVATVAPWGLLLPWSLQLLEPDGPLWAGVGQQAGGELWRWLLLSPELVGFPGLIAGVGFLLAGLLGLVLGTSRSAGLVASLWAVALAGAGAAWWMGRTGSVTWPGVPLLFTAAAFAGLLAMAFASAEASLSRFGFGWRQVAVATTGIAVAVSLGAVAVDLVRSPWDAYAVDDPALPAFISSAAEHQSFRVLVLSDTDDGVLWEVVDGGGPTMASYGVPESPALEQVERSIADALDRRDPHALSRLGSLNVRFVLVPSGATSPALDTALRAQTGIDPRPIAGARLFQITGWMPPVSLVASDDADVLLDRGYLPPGAAVLALQKDEDGVYRSRPRVDGNVVIADANDAEWSASANGQALERVSGEHDLTFETTSEVERVAVVHEGGPARRLAVTGQVIAVVLAISLALRPPNFARRREKAATDVADRTAVSEVGV